LAPPVRFLDTQAALDGALATLREHEAIALDTETDAFFAYRPKICLLQFSVPGLDLVVDPLADLDLDGIGALLADPSRQIVLHAAENDIILMNHQYGWRVANLFDTQVASFVLGLSPYSLAGILEARFGVKLDKSQQRSDWRQRPLSEAQLAYAAEDTRYLPDLARELKERAVEAGRLEEIAWECRRIAEREWEPEPFDPEAFRKLSGAKELSGARLRLLRDLFVLRHKEADRRDRAPYRIIPDHALVALARGADGQGAEPPRGVPHAFWRRYGSRVRNLWRRARERGPLPPPRNRRGKSGPRTPPEVKRRIERLKRWRARAAEERGVEAFVVARNELLQRVALAGCTTLDELADHVEPFRAREYGEAMLAAMLDPGAGGSHNGDDS
jgi:ribonuclease D